MGGASIFLALIVIVLITNNKSKEDDNIAKANLLPVMFNSNWGFAVGIFSSFKPDFIFTIFDYPSS